MRAFRKAPHRHAVLDRSPQALPIPLGGMDRVRVVRRRPAVRRWLARQAPLFLTVAGMIAALAGAVITVAAGPATVYRLGNEVHVGSAVLRMVRTTSDTTVYDGDAAYVLSERPDGSARATAAWGAQGAHSSATCAMRRESERLVEQCSFVVDGHSFTALDTLDFASGGIWKRTYGDGRQETIAVPPDGAAVPLPFPVGR